MAVIVDGQESSRYPDVSAPKFSPDSSRIAYQVQNNRVSTAGYVVVDGVAGTHYSAIDMIEHFRFSPDSKHFAYVASGYAIRDGVRGKHYDHIYTVTFSPDSEHLAYIAQIGEEEYCFVLDEVESKYYPYISILDVVFSPDSKHVAYIAGSAGNERLVVDGVEGKCYYMIGAPVFSPDSQRIAYPAMNLSLFPEYIAVVDGVESQKYDEDWVHPVFSPDSRHVAYWAFKKGKWFIVVDGTEGKQYQDPAEMFRYISVGRELVMTFVEANVIRYIAYENKKAYMVEETLIPAKQIEND